MPVLCMGLCSTEMAFQYMELSARCQLKKIHIGTALTIEFFIEHSPSVMRGADEQMGFLSSVLELGFVGEEHPERAPGRRLRRVVAGRRYH